MNAVSIIGSSLEGQTATPTSDAPAAVRKGKINMGKMKEFPRCNVVSFRLSDEEMRLFENFRGEVTRQEIMILILSVVIFRKEKAVCETA